MRSLVLRRELLLVLAVAAFVAAAFLVAVAVDVDRWRTTIAEDDVRYRVFSADDLWSPDTVAPFGAGRRLLGVEDDVAFRQALRALRASELNDPTVSDPNLAVKRTEAAERLESIVVSDRDDERRSRAANLLGVLGMIVFNSSPSGGNAHRPLGAAAERDRELRAGDRDRPGQRRGEVQPPGDPAARAGPAPDRGLGRAQPGPGRPRRPRGRRRPAGQRVLRPVVDLSLLTPLGVLLALGVVAARSSR